MEDYKDRSRLSIEEKTKGLIVIWKWFSNKNGKKEKKMLSLSINQINEIETTARNCFSSSQIYIDFLKF